MKPKILILSYSPLHKDPRILRQIEALSGKYDLTAAGYSDPKNPAVRFYDITYSADHPFIHKLKKIFFFFFRFYSSFYWDEKKEKFLAIIKEEKFDLIIANEIYTLPLALKISSGTSKVFFDAHEYHPRELDDNLQWRIFHKPYIMDLCKKYIAKCDAMCTVGEIIAKEYTKNYEVNPFVITNASKYQDINPVINTNEDKIRMIHHGSAISTRRLELMIEMMNFTDQKFYLDFMLVPSEVEYYEKLKKLANKNPRIRFVEPVEFGKIVSVLHSYDIGIYILPPTNFNNENALPNKIFEFIQARLAIAVSPSPEMANMVRKYNLGVVSKAFTARAMADSVNQLTLEKIKNFKLNAHNYSFELSSERNNEILSSKINELLSQ
jgi:hypothetical protein